MHKLALLLALGLLVGGADAATRVKGHWDAHGRWVPAQWVEEVDRGTGRPRPQLTREASHCRAPECRRRHRPRRPL